MKIKGTAFMLADYNYWGVQRKQYRICPKARLLFPFLKKPCPVALLTRWSQGPGDCIQLLLLQFPHVSRFP